MELKMYFYLKLVLILQGSIVTKDVPDNCVVAGNPAKVIRHMPPRETVTPKRKPVEL